MKIHISPKNALNFAKCNSFLTRKKRGCGRRVGSRPKLQRNRKQEASPPPSLALSFHNVLPRNLSSCAGKVSRGNGSSGQLFGTAKNGSEGSREERGRVGECERARPEVRRFQLSTNQQEVEARCEREGEATGSANYACARPRPPPLMNFV